MFVKGYTKTSHGDTIRAQPGSNYSRRRSGFPGYIQTLPSPFCSTKLVPPRLSPGMVVKDHTETSHGVSNTVRAKPGSNDSIRLSGRCQGAIHFSSISPLIQDETTASSHRREELTHGRKRALLCGLLYKNSAERLEGCENDVYIVKKLLVELYGFSDSSILILTENQSDPNKHPTKCNIMNALKWLVHGCGLGDSMVFYFSGHGFRNSKGHNLELCPSDYEYGPERTIVDDELNETIIKPLPQGAKLHLIIDACNSGNAVALPYRYKVHRYRRQGGHWNMYPHQLMRNGENGGEVICFSACDDYQTAREITQRVESRDFETRGAMTSALVEAISEKQPHRITYGELLHKIICTVRKEKGKKCGRLKQVRLKQLPQLTSNEPFGVGNKIFCL